MKRRTIRIAIGITVGVGLLLAVLDRAAPPDLRRYQETSFVVADREGVPLRRFLTSDGMLRLRSAPATVDPLYLDMVQAFEDKRFAYHPGIDPLAAARAALQWIRHGRIVSGASTLSMQAARLLEPGAHTVTRKARQAMRALQLERRYSKAEVLSIYLTLAPFGGNLEGVRAASMAYFGKEPRHLRPAEAALLVALPQAPERLRPDRFAAQARQARDRVLERAYARGLIDVAALNEALAETLPTARRPQPFLAPHLATWLARQRPADEVANSAIDRALQQQVEALAVREAEALADHAQVAIIVVENRSRAVRAHVGGTDYFGSYGQVDLVRARRSPGSALKPLIYALAFDEGLASPDSLIRDVDTSFAGYAPRNFDRSFQGAVTARDALRQSLNVPAVALVNRLGPERVAAALGQMGAELTLPPGAQPSLPIALGGAGISLADLTMLYVGLARGGEFAPLVFVEGGGSAVPPRALMSSCAAAEVRDTLAGSPPPDGFTREGVRQLGVAFKTGTSYGFRDAWAVGWNAEWTIGVWVGRPEGTPRPGQVARAAAAPILLKTFIALDRDTARGLPQADNARKPVKPSEFPVREAISRVDVLQIVFPPTRAEFELAAGHVLPLRASGGQGAVRWLVDGTPIEDPRAWSPEGEGFFRVVAVDSQGRQSEAAIRVRHTK